jgi:hypothetical protein
MSGTKLQLTELQRRWANAFLAAMGEKGEVDVDIVAPETRKVEVETRLFAKTKTEFKPQLLGELSEFDTGTQRNKVLGLGEDVVGRVGDSGFKDDVEGPIDRIIVAIDRLIATSQPLPQEMFQKANDILTNNYWEYKNKYDEVQKEILEQVKKIKSSKEDTSEKPVVLSKQDKKIRENQTKRKLKLTAIKKRMVALEQLMNTSALEQDALAEQIGSWDQAKINQALQENPAIAKAVRQHMLIPRQEAIRNQIDPEQLADLLIMKKKKLSGKDQRPVGNGDEKEEEGILRETDLKPLIVEILKQHGDKKEYMTKLTLSVIMKDALSGSPETFMRLTSSPAANLVVGFGEQGEQGENFRAGLAKARESLFDDLTSKKMTVMEQVLDQRTGENGEKIVERKQVPKEVIAYSDENLSKFIVAFVTEMRSTALPDNMRSALMGIGAGACELGLDPIPKIQSKFILTYVTPRMIFLPRPPKQEGGMATPMKSDEKAICKVASKAVQNVANGTLPNDPVFQLYPLTLSAISTLTNEMQDWATEFWNDMKNQQILSKQGIAKEGIVMQPKQTNQPLAIETVKDDDKIDNLPQEIILDLYEKLKLQGNNFSLEDFQTIMELGEDGEEPGGETTLGEILEEYKEEEEDIDDI